MSWDSLPHQLRGFADELANQTETVGTASALRSFSAKFLSGWRDNGRIEAIDIPIPVPRNQQLHPVGSWPVQAFLSFTFELGDCDPGFPDRAEFQVRVESLYAIPNRAVHLEDHWRIDTDTFSNPRSARPPGWKPSKEPHPYYHYQRGGHAQTNFASQPFFVPGPSLPPTQDWKGLAQAPGPRVAVPPMCPLLAIDYAIAEHDGLIWRRLRGRAAYAAYIRQAQERLWVPFFEALRDQAQRRFWFGPLILI